MKKALLSILILFLLFFTGMSYAQDCTRGQTVTFAQLPITRIAGTTCTVTDSPNCAGGSIIAAGGGAITCKLAWNGSAWFVTTQTPLTQGGPVPSYGAPQTSLLTAASGTYTTPTGATHLDVCVFGAGGGGGAATSGGAAAHSGGGGGSGSVTCGYITSSIQATYAYVNGIGGSAGTCSATPTAAGNASGSSTFGTSPLRITGVGANGGGTATTVADGVGGVNNGLPANFVNSIPFYLMQTGATGQTGTGAVASLGSNFAGAVGGTGATVTAGGACNTAATAGGNGWMRVIAYFN